MKKTLIAIAVVMLRDRIFSLDSRLTRCSGAFSGPTAGSHASGGSLSLQELAAGRA